MNALKKIQAIPLYGQTNIQTVISMASGWLAGNYCEDSAAELERLQKIEAAAVNLFQACADLPVAEMDRMEAVINAMSEALK